jgi:hypothetical protein
MIGFAVCLEPQAAGTMPDTIVAEGVRVHNLKGIDVSIPRGDSSS